MPNIFPCKMGEHSTPAVPARDASGARLPLQVIGAYAHLAVEYARSRPDQNFRVQQDGWGYPRQQIAPLFDGAPMNITLPYGFMF